MRNINDLQPLLEKENHLKVAPGEQTCPGLQTPLPPKSQMEFLK